MSKEHELCENHNYYNTICGFAEIKARKIIKSSGLEFAHLYLVMYLYIAVHP